MATENFDSRAALRTNPRTGNDAEVKLDMSKKAETQAHEFASRCPAWMSTTDSSSLKPRIHTSISMIPELSLPSASNKFLTNDQIDFLLATYAKRLPYVHLLPRGTEISKFKPSSSTGLIIYILALGDRRTCSLVSIDLTEGVLRRLEFSPDIVGTLEPTRLELEIANKFGLVVDVHIADSVLSAGIASETDTHLVVNAVYIMYGLQTPHSIDVDQWNSHFQEMDIYGLLKANTFLESRNAIDICKSESKTSVMHTCQEVDCITERKKDNILLDDLDASGDNVRMLGLQEGAIKHQMKIDRLESLRRLARIAPGPTSETYEKLKEELEKLRMDLDRKVMQMSAINLRLAGRFEDHPSAF